MRKKTKKAGFTDKQRLNWIKKVGCSGFGRNSSNFNWFCWDGKKYHFHLSMFQAIDAAMKAANRKERGVC